MVPAMHGRPEPRLSCLWHARRLAALAVSVTLALSSSLALVPPFAHAATAEDPLAGPDIVIIAESDRTIYEFRQNGQLRMIRIEPKSGKPYYLVPRDPTRGYGDLERADMLLPSWVIMSF